MDPPPVTGKRIDRGAPQAAAAAPRSRSVVPVPIPKPKAKTSVEPRGPRTLDERVAHFAQRLNEYGINDYAEPEDHEDVDDETLMAMSRNFEKDPENYGFLTDKTRKALADRDEALDKIREEHLIQKGILPEGGKRDPIEFEELVKKQMAMHKIEDVQVPDAVPGGSKEDASAKPKSRGSRRYGFETEKSNLMIARDPEQDYEPDRLIGSIPRPLSRHDPYALPSLPSSLLSNPELEHDERTHRVLSVLQKYQIRASRKLYYEADIETFRKEIGKEVSDEYKVVRTNQCIMCIYLIFTPLCIHCKFARRRDAEKTSSGDCPAPMRMYAWEGYALTEIMTDEETKRLRIERAEVPGVVPEANGFE